MPRRCLWGAGRGFRRGRGRRSTRSRRYKKGEEDKEEEGVTNTSNPCIKNEELLLVAGCDLIDKVKSFSVP